MMDERELALVTIGDLELTRRQLMLEIQARDALIEQLQQQPAGHEEPEAPA